MNKVDIKGKVKNLIAKNKKEWTENDLYEFLLGNIQNDSKKSIYDLWYADTYFLEHNHKYMDWMFPLDVKSNSSTTPIILNKDMFMGNKEIRKNILISFSVFLKFLGLKYEDGKVIRGSNFASRSILWLNWDNHNYKRISRILRCLMLMGCEKEALAFYECLSELYESGYNINRESLLHWRDEVGIIW